MWLAAMWARLHWHELGNPDQLSAQPGAPGDDHVMQGHASVISAVTQLPWEAHGHTQLSCEEGTSDIFTQPKPELS